jgi:hypothetical protein
MEQHNIIDPFVGLVSIFMMEAVLLTRLQHLSAERTGSVLSPQHLAKEPVDRLSFQQLIAIAQVLLPFAVEGIGLCPHLDVPLMFDRLLDMDEGLAQRGVREGPLVTILFAEIPLGNPDPALVGVASFPPSEQPAPHVVVELGERLRAAMFAITGLITPPWGTPWVVANHLPLSIKPLCNQARNTLRFIGMFSNIHSNAM